MLRKLLVVISLFALSATAVFAQQTSPDGRRAQVFAYGNLFEGSYLGVETKDISRENFAQYGLKEVRGVAVEKVSENSRFDGAEVTSVRKLQRLISEIAPDHQATLTVFRNGSEREIKVTMGKREVPRFEGSANLFESAPPIALMPDMPRVPLPPSAPIAPLGDVEGFYSFFNSNRQMGVSVTSLTKQLGEYFGAPEGRGVLISSVRENSPADKAGLRAGDVIIEVEGKEVKGTSDLMRLINEKKDSAVNLTVIRNKSRMNVSVTPEKSK
jgi:serine protease Do